MFKAIEIAEKIPFCLPKYGLPVTIITGFLGSGKTTLLNRILNDHHNLKIAVLVNEFGDINIDTQLLVTMEEDVIELSNGCICCTMNDSLVEAIYDVLEREERVDYMVIETTGLANPLPIALTLLSPELQNLTQLDSILTVLDAENFSVDLFNSEPALSQLIYGDILLLNKADLVSEDQLKSIEEYCEMRKQGARILRCERGRVPLAAILGVGGSALDLVGTSLPVDGVSLNHLSQDGFTAFSFRSDRPLTLHRFELFLADQLPESVYRAKGILWFAERPEDHFVFQLSGKRFTLDKFTGSKASGNQLVVIGKRLNMLQLQQQLNNCLGHL